MAPPIQSSAKAGESTSKNKRKRKLSRACKRKAKAGKVTVEDEDVEMEENEIENENEDEEEYISDESTNSQSRAALQVDRKSPDTKYIVVYKESELFAQFGKNIIPDVDNFPSILLTDVEVIPNLGAKGDSFFQNILLQAKPGSKLEIEGIVIIDRDNEDLLAKYFADKAPADRMGKKKIHLTDVQVYSIGFTVDHRTYEIWVLGTSAWFQIRPSAGYRELYEDQRRAIACRFQIEEFYYGKREPKVQSDEDEVNEILHLCEALSVGAGDNNDVWIKRCRKYRDFFLSQMDQMDIDNGGRGIAQRTALYQWFLRGTFTLVPISKAGRYAGDPYVVDYDTSQSSGDEISGDAVDRNPSVSIALATTPSAAVSSNNSSSPGQEPLKMIKACHKPYISKQFPRGVQPNSKYLEQAAALICHAVESGRCADPSKLTIESIDTAAYLDFNLGRDKSISKSLLGYFGQDVVQRLPVEFEKYPFYAALNVPRKDLSHYEELNLNQNVGRVRVPRIDNRGPQIHARFLELVKNEEDPDATKGVRRRRKTKDGSAAARTAKAAASRAKKLNPLSTEVAESSESDARSGKKRGRVAIVGKEIEAITEPTADQTAFDAMSIAQKTTVVVAKSLDEGARSDAAAAANVAGSTLDTDDEEPRPFRRSRSRRSGLS